MFNYQQTKLIKDTATAKGLELWEVIKLHAYVDSSNNLNSTQNAVLYCIDEKFSQDDSAFAKDFNGLYCTNFIDFDGATPALTLDSLIPWLTKIFVKDGVAIENAEFIKILKQLKNERNEQIFGLLKEELYTTPKTLADKLIQQATTQYFTNSETLTNDICEAINENF